MISKQPIAFNNIPRFFTALSYCNKGPNLELQLPIWFYCEQNRQFHCVCNAAGSVVPVQQRKYFCKLNKICRNACQRCYWWHSYRQCISTEGKWWQFQKILQQVYTHTEADHKICFQQAFKYFHGIVYAQVLTYQRKSRTVFIRLMPSQPLCAGFRCHNISIHCENKCLLANIFCQPILRGMQCR